MSTHLAPHVVRRYRRIQRVLDCLDPATRSYAFLAPGSVQPRKHIIVFPGSFNPPTHAHLAMLQQAQRFARQQGGSWQVYAALSKYSVDKETVERMTLLDRVALLSDVFKDQGMRTGIMLLNKGLYVEQAQGICAAFPHVRRLFFLLGFDKIVQILDHRYYTERDTALHKLFSLAGLLVAPRGAGGQHELAELLARPENRPFARSIRALPLAERYRHMSSSQVRQGAQWADLPALVRDFIWRTHPYAVPDSHIDVYAERTRALQTQLCYGL